MAHQKKDTIKSLTKQPGLFTSDDSLRMLLQRLVQELLESEMEHFLQAESYERTSERTGYRNGYKPRMLNTRVGTLELMIPKDREGRFRTELFERYQRSEKALLLSLTEMYVQGVSTRKVKKITETLCGLEISKSQVSELSKKLDIEIEIWRNRPLTKEYSYLVADARYEHMRNNGSVTGHGVLIVIGIDKDGYREPLGVWTADSESETSWSDAFNSLKDRGLRGIKYVVSDDHKGLKKAVMKCFQGAFWQRCQVHFIRNILKRASRKDRAHIMTYMREITSACSAETARKRIREAVVQLERKHPKVAAMLDEQAEEILAIYQLPKPHRQRMKSTNMLERLNQEIKRRTRVIRIFPNEQSCIRLVASLVMETAEEWMERKYLDMEAIEEDTVKLKKEKAA